MPQESIAAFSDVLRFFEQDEETIQLAVARFSSDEVARSCARARACADRLRGIDPVSVPARISAARWSVAAGKIVYLAESCLRTGNIRLNLDAIDSLSESLQDCPLPGDWGKAEKITEAVTAHEIYHLLERRCSSPQGELEACVFARHWLRMPFSPMLYEWALRRLARMVGVGRAGIVQPPA